MAKGSVKEDILTEKQNLSILLGARPWFFYILSYFKSLQESSWNLITVLHRAVLTAST
jgi:hypothetical protein